MRQFLDVIIVVGVVVLELADRCKLLAVACYLAAVVGLKSERAKGIIYAFGFVCGFIGVLWPNVGRGHRVWRRPSPSPASM